MKELLIIIVVITLIMIAVFNLALNHIKIKELRKEVSLLSRKRKNILELLKENPNTINEIRENTGNLRFLMNELRVERGALEYVLFQLCRDKIEENTKKIKDSLQSNNYIFKK